MKMALMIVFAFLWSPISYAQQTPTLNVIVEDLDQDAVACGAIKDSVEAIANLTLRNNGVRGVSSTTNPYLYVLLSAIHERQSCVIALQISVRATNLHALREFGRFSPREFFGTTVMCDAGALLTGNAATMGQRITSALEEKIKICLGKLNY